MSNIAQLGLTTPWRLLGASAGLTYTYLGLWQVFAPNSALPGLFAVPLDDTGRYLIPISGAREASIGAAVIGLLYTRSFREAGIVITASMIVIVVDMVQCWEKWDTGV